MRLLHAGKYEKAKSVCQRMLARNSRDELGQVCMAYTNLCLGDYDSALEGFVQANVRAKRKPVGCRHPYVQEIAVVLWLMGRREEALRRFRRCVDGILDGTIEYADFAGGASQGLLLWYAAVTLHDDEAAENALAYMRGLAEKDRIRNWPGPLAEYAIGTLSRDQLLRAAFSTKCRLLIRLKAVLNGGIESRLSHTVFYFGVSARMEGNERVCLSWMDECSRSQSHPGLLEWHLARAEVRQAKLGG